MSEPRMGLACAVFRGRIWACGGRNGQTRYATCEAYHPSVSFDQNFIKRFCDRKFWSKTSSTAEQLKKEISVERLNVAYYLDMGKAYFLS